MTDRFIAGWNAAIRAAEKAVTAAPVFPKKDRGPIADGERLMILEACRKQVESLKKETGDMG